MVGSSSVDYTGGAMESKMDLRSILEIELAAYAQRIVDAKFAVDHILVLAEKNDLKDVDARIVSGLIEAKQLANHELWRISEEQQYRQSA